MDGLGGRGIDGQASCVTTGESQEGSGPWEGPGLAGRAEDARLCVGGQGGGSVRKYLAA